ncbi:hypothetical protein JCM19233_4720 [Vibrio astriarenae]|nr:hypothetical protein JCM19233_4720 [Vibrio sp. C7]
MMTSVVPVGCVDTRARSHWYMLKSIPDGCTEPERVNL